MIFWGAAYVPSGLLVETWPPLSAAGARLALGGLVLLGVLVALGRPAAPGVGALTVGWLALTQTVLFYGATFWGIAHAGAGLSAVLANTDPLFVAILAGPVLGERLGGPQWAGLAVGLVGAACVVWEGPLWPPQLSSAALVVVGGALAWSIGTVVAARSMRSVRADPLALAGWQMAVGGVVLGLAGALAHEGAPPLGAPRGGPHRGARGRGLGGAARALLPGAGARARLGGVGLVLPHPGDRGAERLALPRRGAERRGWWSAWWGCRSGSGWCSARAARGRGGW